MSVVTDNGERIDPSWQLPAYIDQVERLHFDLYCGYCRRAQWALDCLGEEPSSAVPR